MPVKITQKEGVNWGRPYIDRTGTPCHSLASMFRGGDSIEELRGAMGAGDLTTEEVEAAVRYDVNETEAFLVGLLKEARSVLVGSYGMVPKYRKYTRGQIVGIVDKLDAALENIDAEEASG